MSPYWSTTPPSTRPYLFFFLLFIHAARPIFQLRKKRCRRRWSREPYQFSCKTWHCPDWFAPFPPPHTHLFPSLIAYHQSPTPSSSSHLFEKYYLTFILKIWKKKKWNFKKKWNSASSWFCICCWKHVHVWFKSSQKYQLFVCGPSVRFRPSYRKVLHTQTGR